MHNKRCRERRTLLVFCDGFLSVLGSSFSNYDQLIDVTDPYSVTAKLSKANKLRMAALTQAAQSGTASTTSGTATSLTVTPVQGVLCLHVVCWLDH